MEIPIRQKNTMWVTAKDMLRLAVTCRCGTRSVYQTAQQVQEVESLHPCPNCGVFFRIKRDSKTKKWNVIRTDMNTSNTVFVDANGNVKKG